MVIHDESGTPLAGEICPNPLQENGQTKTRGRQKLEVDERPGEPCREPAHSELVTLQDGKSFTNDRHVAFVEVTKRTGRRAAGYAGMKNFSSITTLLHGHLGNAGKRLAGFFGCGRCR